MKESLDCDCGVCSICSGLRRPNESHEDAALRRGTQPTDVQQLKAEILPILNEALESLRLGDLDDGENLINQVMAKLSAV
jgi:hypothetical protein